MIPLRNLEGIYRPTQFFGEKVSQVSSQWRQTAVSNSASWTQIRPTWRPERVNLWFDHSNDRPLDIDLWA